MSAHKPHVTQDGLARDASSLGREVELLNHDIRSAVSDVIGGLRLIETRDLDPVLRDQLGGVQAASEVLARLIEDALLLVSGEKQQPPLASNLHLRRLLQDMDRRWSMRGTFQGVRFKTKVADDVPDVVQLNRLALERVLANLIGNAVKYAGEGRVSMTVSKSDTDELCFVVEDTGPGFSEAALSRLFAANARPDEGALAGNGLGLHIAKQNADILGARLAVENRAEGGARATLEVPYRAWHGAAPESNTAPDLSAYRILVADDNDTNQLLVSQMLASMGAECELASDGIEALNWLGRERFDLALIDIEMPRLGGLDVLRAARRRQSTGLNPAMPMIAMTAYVLRDNRDAIYAAGADGLLAKPLVSVESFGHALLHYIVSHKASQGTSQDLYEVPQDDGDELACFDVATLDRLLEIAGADGGAELMSRLQSDLKNVEAGLRSGLSQRLLSEIRSQTHVLISLSSAVGSSRLQALTQALNTGARQNDVSAVERRAPAVLTHLAHLREALAAYCFKKDRA